MRWLCVGLFSPIKGKSAAGVIPIRGRGVRHSSRNTAGIV